MRRFGKSALGYEYEAGGPVQTGTVAIGTGAHAKEPGQFLADRHRFGLAVTALEIGQDALEGMPLASGLALALGVAELEDRRTAAVQQNLLNLRRQLAPGRFDVEIVVTRERLDELKVIRVAPVPTADRAARQREIRMHDDALGIEELFHPKAVAGGAGSGRVVERKQLRLERRHAIAAHRAGMPS